jgi:ribosome biogenesis GTPase A
MNTKINWFPGHMYKSLQGLDKYIRQCDVILYVLDARCPQSCVNPSFASLTARKPVLFILNKADLAPAARPGRSGTLSGAISLNSTRDSAIGKVLPAIKKLFPARPRVHAMVIGVPNCGKSTLINNFAHRAKAKTADRPGVTRQPQWVCADGGQLYLLDTPGILWPDLADQSVARNLAFIGSIRDEVLDTTELARELLTVAGRGGEVLEDFASRRGHILAGGKLDLERAARTVLAEFRSGKMGKFNLDAHE